MKEAFERNEPDVPWHRGWAPQQGDGDMLTGLHQSSDWSYLCFTEGSSFRGSMNGDEGRSHKPVNRGRWLVSQQQNYCGLNMYVLSHSYQRPTFHPQCDDMGKWSLWEHSSQINIRLRGVRERERESPQSFLHVSSVIQKADPHQTWNRLCPGFFSLQDGKKSMAVICAILF